ncbi:hypothetical protein SODALDRAFT_362295 [Sodiomyces alkalinus F11]|uniref:Wax synthase domain-containing protein n=1 Tax=Sodiomyces alkalinus (strain CBS 110278 / VKM F-3762 / F11) TaxID=1314773 RepID=A0A3N2PPV9_SODAK|nr:hypothetical protein SODALDRAFT_362295 [Sodiomyces alkalinus F11]ROT36484.1 hypothetical protein SODALDRAFT_362295 [Sodiomyces alkalinus F11]
MCLPNKWEQGLACGLVDNDTFTSDTSDREITAIPGFNMWDMVSHPGVVLVTNPLLALASLYTPQQYRLLPFGLLVLQFWNAICYVQYQPGLASFFFLPHDFDWYVGDMLAKAITIVMMHFGVILILEKHKAPPASGSRLAQLQAAYKTLSNFRRIGTNMVAPQVPVLADDPTQVEREKEEDTAPQNNDKNNSNNNNFRSRVGVVHREPRLCFLARRSALTILLLSAEFWLKPLVWAMLINPGYEDYTPDKEAFFRRLPGMSAGQLLREFAIRNQIVFEAFWSAYAVYTAAHAIFAVVCVGIGFDEPHEWPPLFGDIRESYSMRRFWVKFYDRLLYRTLKGCALLIARLVGLIRREGDTDGTLKGYALYVLWLLGIARREDGDDDNDDDAWKVGKGRGEGEPWRRWLLNAIIFAVSAWFHAHTSWWAGWRCAYWPEVGWWATSFLAVIGEMAAQEMMRKWARRLYEKLDSGWIGKAVGFATCIPIIYASL